MRKIVVMPVYEDLEASSKLFVELARTQGPDTYVVAVDDGSVRQPLPISAIEASGLEGVVIRLLRGFTGAVTREAVYPWGALFRELGAFGFGGVLAGLLRQDHRLHGNPHMRRGLPVGSRLGKPVSGTRPQPQFKPAQRLRFGWNIQPERQPRQRHLVLLTAVVHIR